MSRMPVRCVQQTILAVIMALSHASCHSLQPAAKNDQKEPPTKSTEQSGQKWFLTEMSGAIAMKSDSGSPEIFLVLDSANRVYGSGGCNRFFGSYHIGNDGSVVFSDLGSTKMACEHLKTEELFFEALDQASRVVWEDKSMILLTKTGKLLARFSMEIPD